MKAKQAADPVAPNEVTTLFREGTQLGHWLRDRANRAETSREDVDAIDQFMARLKRVPLPAEFEGDRAYTIRQLMDIRKTIRQTLKAMKTTERLLTRVRRG